MRKLTNYYNSERLKGRKFSAILHLLFLFLAYFGLPSFLSPRPPEEPTAITVELLPITGVTNIRPSEKTPAPTPKPEDKQAEAKAAAEAHNRKPTPQVKTVENTPPPPPKQAETPVPKKEAKKPEPKKENKKKPKEDDLAAVLKAVKAQAEQEKNAQDKPKTDANSQTKSQSDQYNPDLPMSMSERDAIKNQMRQCWNVPAGARNAQDLVVVIDIEFAQDGSVIKVQLADESKARYNSDSFFQAAAESAIRAVHLCSPLKGLPPEKYSTWHYTEMRFDPKEMLN